MDVADALAFARGRRDGVLATQKRDGRPQLSNIWFDVGDDDVVRISVTAPRAKAVNLRRDPRASLHVTDADFGTYVVLEGDAELSPVAASPDDATVAELAALYRRLRGEDHPDPAEYGRVMVQDQRLVVRLRVDHAYGNLRR